MQTDLEQMLRQEHDDVLFENMKHNSKCSFEEKIISGRILCERQEFDRMRMSTEKKMLIDEMKEKLKDYNNPLKSTKTLRNRSILPLLWSVIFTLVFGLSEVLDCLKFDKGFDWIGLSIFLFFVLLTLCYEFATLNKQLRKRFRLADDMKELLTNRLNRIEQEWHF